MKFMAYNVRDDETDFVKNWAAENQIEVTITKERLNAQTADLAKESDGICALQTDPYDAEVFEKMASFGIRCLAIRSVGFESVDIEAAKVNQIKVTNVPGYSPSAIAEFSVGQALQLIRRTPYFNKRIANQDFRWDKYISKELKHMTVGVIGTGRIGQSAISIYKGFGSKILAYDLYPNQALKDSVTYVDSVSELVKAADLITLHAPLTSDNYHVIDKDAIDLMKEGVYIVNTARGGLVDTKALINGLNSGKIAGAALDTYENESAYFAHDWQSKDLGDPILEELLSREDVLVTPHIAFYTETAVQNMVDISLNSLKELVTEGNSQNEIY